MNDASFRRLGAACAMAFALCTVLYALLLFLDSEGIELSARLEAAVRVRGVNQPANLLLGCAGLLATVGVAAVYEAVRERGGAWARWAAGLGLIGAVLTAAHGLWDFMRVPVLVAQWDSAIPERQAAIATFAGQPNPVDPRGLGTFLFMGLFAIVTARWLAGDRPANALVAPVGLVYGALLLAAFVSGFVGPDATRAGIAALSMGVAGPLWWLLVATALWRQPEAPARR